MSLKDQAVSSVFWVFIHAFGSQGITFFVSIVLARFLEPSEFGLIAMLSVFIAIGNNLINSGLTQSLIRLQQVDEEDFSTVFYFNIIVSIIVYVLIFFLAPYIALFYNEEQLTNVVRIYSFSFIINAFSSVQSARLTKMLDFKTQMKVSFPSIIIGGISGILLAYNGYGVWSLVWSSLIQTFLSTIQLWYWSKWKPLFVFRIIKFKSHFQYGVNLTFSGILDALFTEAYTIIIGKFFLATQVGFYNRANTLQKLPVTNISSIITRVTFPLFSAIQNDDARLKSAYMKIMQIVVFITAPVLILMAVLAEPLFRFLFTDKWLPAVPYFRILCINGILFPIHSYNLQILKVKGRSDLFLRLEILKKILICIVISISFKYGIFGLLYGSVITSVIAFFINSHYSGKIIKYSAWNQIKDIFPIILLSCFMGTAIYFWDSFIIFKSNDFLRLFIGSMTGILLYISLSYLFRMSVFVELKNILIKK